MDSNTMYEKWNFFIEKCFLDLVREFEELKEGQSESEGGGITIQDFQVTINRDYIKLYFLLGMSVLLGWLSQLIEAFSREIVEYSMICLILWFF